MTYSVHITTAAERDVANATDYIDQVLKNPKAADDPKAADELLEAFLQQVNDLAVFPARYPLARDEILAAWGIRFLRIKNYIAFYLIDDAREMIYVIRFLYGKSNWASILKNSIAN